MLQYFRDIHEVPKSNDANAFSSSSPTKSKIIVETVKESDVITKSNTSATAQQ